MDTVIQVENLTHSYGERLAVDHLSFEAGRGEVLGLLGPNGAGKTTTIRLLNGLFHPSSGRCSVLGLNPVTQGEAIRRQTGVLTETPALYERLTALQNLEFFGTLSGMKPGDLSARVQELLAFFELSERASDRVQTYSKGMKQRLALARALLTSPELLFLDEPTSGLDPEAARQVHELINSLRKHDGHTVLLCTHNLDEAARLCDRLAVMNHGRLLALGSLADLRARFAPGLRLQVGFFQPPPVGLDVTVQSIPGVKNLSAAGALTWELEISEESVIPAIVFTLAARQVQILSVQPVQPSLEDLYFRLQNEAEEGAQ